MAYYSQSSGVASALARWNTAANGSGSAPAIITDLDNVAVTVQGGHLVQDDVDMSAWTNGIAGLTITGVASGTPGTWYWKGGASGYLKLKTGTTIAGTSATVKGRLLANSDGVWGTTTPLAKATTAIINPAGTAYIAGANLDVQLYGTEPTYKYVRMTVGEALGATAIRVDTNVTGDWVVGDTIEVVNINRAIDRQRTTIAAGGIAAGTITLTNALDSANIAGAYLFNVTRNVAIRFLGTQNVIQGCVNGVFQCEVQQTHATTCQGGLVYSGLGGNTFSGVFSGIGTCVYDSQNPTMSGVFVGGTAAIGIYYNYGGSMTGICAGFNQGANNAYGVDLSGSFVGCGTGIVGSVACRIGNVVGCGYGIAACAGCDVVGNVQGNTVGIDMGSGRMLDSARIGGSGSLANSTDLGGPCRWFGYETSLASTTQHSNYRINGGLSGSNYTHFQDVADANNIPQPGQIAAWTCGGYAKSEAWANARIAHYQMNNTSGTTVTDSSGNARNGTAARDTSLFTAAGKLGTCLDFNGTTDKVNCGTDFIGTTACTIAAWIYLDSFGNLDLGRIVDNGKLIFYLNGNCLQVTNDGVTLVHSSAGSMATSSWKHVAVSRTAAGIVNFYVNGTLNNTANQAAGTPTTATTNLFIGNRLDNARGFDGKIDDLRIYNVALTASEIATLYNSGTGTAADTFYTPPVTLAYVHKHTFEDIRTNYIDIPLLGQAGAPLLIRVYARKPQALSAMGTGATLPTAKICDPQYPFEHASEALNTATMADNQDWQTLTLSYTPTRDGPLVFRVGGNASTGYLYWNYDLLSCRLPCPATRLIT